MLRPGGTAVYIGLPGHPRETINTSISQLVESEITVRGSNVGTRLDLKEAVDVAVRGQVAATVRQVTLDDVNDVFADMSAGRIVGRVVLTPRRATVAAGGFRPYGLRSGLRTVERAGHQCGVGANPGGVVMLHDGEFDQFREQIVERATELLSDGQYVEIPVVYYRASLALHQTYGIDAPRLEWMRCDYVAIAKVARPGRKPKLYMIPSIGLSRTLRRGPLEAGNFAVLVHDSDHVVFLVVAEHIEKNLRPIVAVEHGQ